MSGFVLHPVLAAADLEATRGLFTEYADSLGRHLCFEGFQRELAELPGEYALPAGRLLLARRADQPAGCVALRPHAPGLAELKRLYVRPPFRGAGLGRLLTLAIIQAAREIGYSRLRLDTLPTMVAAHTLYRSLGFRQLEGTGCEACESAIVMELHLGV